MPVTEAPPRPGLDLGSVRRIAWQQCPIEAVTVETYRVKSFRLGVPDWRPFRPGQHVDVRLTAPDGYQALRS